VRLPSGDPQVYRSARSVPALLSVVKSWGANLRQATESPLLVQARRIALGNRTPVVLANLGSDRYPLVTGK
jgi:hypothetical protein